MKNPKAPTTKQTGNKGEQLTVSFLEKKGYSILERNWFYNKAEVDIIAQKGEFVAFIEVKTRSKKDYLPEEINDLVSVGQQKRIVNAGHHYIVQKDLDCEARFDLVLILIDGDSFTIEHIEEAYYPTL